MGKARLVLTGPIAIDRAFADGMEGFPGDAGRVIDP